MLMRAGDQRHCEIEIIDRVAPGKIWEAVAAAPTRFVLIGEYRHKFNHTRHALAAGLPVLARSGVVHLGLEYHAEDTQPLFNKLATAPTGLRGSFQRLAVASALGNQHLLAWEMPAYWLAMSRVLGRARQHDIQLHALDKKEFRRRDPKVWPEVCAIIDHAEAEYARLSREGNYVPGQRFSPAVKALLQGQKELKGVLNDAYWQRRAEVDELRANWLSQVAGPSRAALFYGHQHFKGGQAPGIGHFLPQDDQVYVALGSSGYLLSRFENSPFPARLPDFVIMSDRGQGIVTEQARTRGLWPG